MNDRVRVAAIQTVSSTSVENNLERAAARIAEAAGGGAELVVLPEYFCIMGREDSDKVKVREELGRGPIQDFLREAATRHKIVLAGGTVPLVSPFPDKVKNTTLVYGRDGELLARYDKIHLFSLKHGAPEGDDSGGESFDEAKTIDAGREPVTFIADFSTGPMQIGLSICYDLRFPELYRKLVDDGKTSLILAPSAFTAVTGKAHWEMLLRARATENQCYLLAAAQGGRHENGRRTWGHSMLVDPWGEIKVELAEGEGVVVGEIDPSFIKAVREKLPALKQRVL
jgi:predicted amidohydrolase